MRAVAYIRVSDLSQVDGYSLDAQERHFYEHCELTLMTLHRWRQRDILTPISINGRNYYRIADIERLENNGSSV